MLTTISWFNVLMDSWYTREKVINDCNHKGFHVIAALKTNRLICPLGVTIKISDFAEQYIRKADLRFVTVEGQAAYWVYPYLDSIPYLFSNVKLIDHMAPWNLVMNNEYTVRKKDNKIFLDDSELIAYHFGSMLILNHDQFDIWKIESLAFNESVINLIYAPYIKSLKDSCNTLKNKVSTDISLFYASPSSNYSPKNLLK
jgi:hypothetical protein